MPRHMRPSSSARTPRRKRVWSREPFLLAAVASGAPAQVDLLAVLKVSLGGGYPLGTTCGPVILSAITVRTTGTPVPTTPSVVLGVRKSSSAIEAVDQDPSTLYMLDWLLWQPLRAAATIDTNAVQTQDEHRSNSMRKLEEVNENLWLVAGTDSTGTYSVTGWASTLVLLA